MKTLSPTIDDMKKGFRVTGNNIRVGEALFATCPESYLTEPTTNDTDLISYCLPGSPEFDLLAKRAEFIKSAIEFYLDAGHELPNA